MLAEIAASAKIQAVISWSFSTSSPGRLFAFLGLQLASEFGDLELAPQLPVSQRPLQVVDLCRSLGLPALDAWQHLRILGASGVSCFCRGASRRQTLCGSRPGGSQ